MWEMRKHVIVIVSRESHTLLLSPEDILTITEGRRWPRVSPVSGVVSHTVG